MESPVSNIPPVSKETEEKFYETLEARREARVTRERKLKKPFDLVVGTCHCKSDILFRFLGDVSPAGMTESKERYRLSCVDGGHVFDREHPPIAEAIKKHRDAL